MPDRIELAIIGLLGTGALGLLATVTVTWLVVTGRRAAARRVAVPLVGLAGLYAGAALVASVSSREVVLEPGEWKYFCEIDCHLAYGVVEVERAARLGGVEAAGEYWVVTIRTWFDERTISDRRPRDLPLKPNPRRVRVVDGSGRSWAPVPGSSEWAGESTPLTRRLVPGESYETRIVFDLPADVTRPLLFLTDSSPVSMVMIGHENSPFHRRILHALVPPG